MPLPEAGVSGSPAGWALGALSVDWVDLHHVDS